MKLLRTELFKKDYKKLPKPVQDQFDKKIILFIENIHHPSLRVKKMKGHNNRWEASIDMYYRFTYEVHENSYLLRRIGPHDKVLKKP